MDGARPRAEVRVLGSIEVVGPAGQANLPGSRQRALVGLLALRAGGVVPRSSLVDALWGEEPPRTAVKTLYSHVTRTRQAIDACGLPGVLATREPGYALGVAAAEVDAIRFEELVRGAGEAPAQDAVTRLEAGLALWRGEPFADGVPAGWGAAEVTRLAQVRLGAIEDLWDARLRLGRHASAAAELDRLAARHPYRERLADLLMLALYRCGRPAEALDRYQRLRAHLADELGVDPGPDLQRRYAAILRHDPGLDLAQPRAAVLPRPAQLPAPPGHFTGRGVELEELSTVDDDTRVIAISGPAGIGKTALAVHWAHTVADRFPDGQLYLDLCGHEERTAVPPGQALPHVLRSLGVPPDRLPAEVAEQAALYRSVLHGKRILVVLDNCRDAEQVLPLVPGTAASLLVVTSRAALTALAARHAVRLVALDVLDRTEALSLVRKVCGPQRVAREPASAADLVELCGRLPLALRIAAATLAGRSAYPIGAFTARLRTQNRLDAFAIEGDSRSVRAAFASAYGSVKPAAARLFRLLALHPGPVLGAHLGAALANQSTVDVHSGLAELAGAHLVTESADRYRFHDLIRLYAQECAQREETPQARDEAVHRLLDWYLAVGELANRTLQPSRDRVTPSLRYRPDSLPFTGSGALEFLDGERANVVPLVRYAATRGHPRAAWQLTYLLAGFFEYRGHVADRVEMCRHAVLAARADGNAFAESLMCVSLAGAYSATGRYADAVGELRRSLALTTELGDLRGQGNALNSLAIAYTGLGRHAEAIESFGRALALYEAGGQRVATALTLNNLGDLQVRSGLRRSGFAHLDRALALARELAEPWLVAAVTHSTGQAYLHVGEHAAAQRHLRSALAARLELGDQRRVGETLTCLGMACLGLADTGAATGYLRRAVAAARAAGDEHQEATALQRLGEAYARDGEKAAAAAQFRLALDLRARVPDAGAEAELRRCLALLSSGSASRAGVSG